MSLAKPSDKVLAEADFEAIREVTDEASRLGLRGEMTPAKYAELWKRGLEAAGGHEELLEGLVRWKP